MRRFPCHRQLKTAARQCFAATFDFGLWALELRRWPPILLLAALAVSGPRIVSAQTPLAPRKSSGKQVALLIGVEKYEKAPPLAFIGNDVRRLSETLRDRGGYDEVIEFTDSSADANRRPLREILLREVPKWLGSRGRDDTLIVFFSGHGFRADDGAMYLAPLDVDPANVKKTGIGVAWFRDQLARCPAELKLLVLDACHAGSIKGEGEANLDQQDLDLFEKLEGVVTLASSTADQSSLVWEEKQQSLFSYWLNQGLKGHADHDGDGQVNIDELNEYVYANVTETARARFSRPQTPVRKIGVGTPGQPVVLYLKPQKLKQVLGDMAQQLADIIADRKLSKVGVLEFTNDTKLGELLGADYGLLGRFCAEQLEERLVKEQRKGFKVVNRRTLQQALHAERFDLADLGSTARLKKLAADAGGMPLIALGMLHNRAGRMLNLRCQLIETATNDVAAAVGGAAWLTESEWGMLGKSVALNPEDRRPEPPADDAPPRPQEDAVVDRMDELAKGPHPMQDPGFPFRVRMIINGKERKGEFRDNDYFLPVRKGEVYELWIENRTGRKALMRLLVDGLNTLPEREGGAETPAVSKGLMTELIGTHVDLDDARPWVLDPDSPLQRASRTPSLFAVRGFVTKTGEQGQLGRFTIVDADRSLAARQKFTDQIGLITAAFYTPRASRSVGTDIGVTIDENLTEQKAEVGNLLAVVHLRYYDAGEPGK
jgi:uncharacterized caspase-like protein